MNQSSKLARFIVALSGALIVVAATWKVRHPSDATRAEASRSVASLRADSAKRARLDTDSQPQNEGKARASFTISISADDGLGGAPVATTLPETRLHLKGRITAERHIAPHDFTWILPENYKTIDGAQRGTIPELQPGQSHEVRLTLDHRNELPQPIVLHVFKIVNSEPRGQVAQFDIVDSVSTISRDPSRTPQKPAAHLRDEKYVQ